ncbi:hypothetical protein EDD15DRAFT_2225613 [Pisolithus albus]|nr:hypothetical protein EDD15DRAFT_2225613 [Pisolithus albus]
MNVHGHSVDPRAVVRTAAAGGLASKSLLTFTPWAPLPVFRGLIRSEQMYISAALLAVAPPIGYPVIFRMNVVETVRRGEFQSLSNVVLHIPISRVDYQSALVTERPAASWLKGGSLVPPPLRSKSLPRRILPSGSESSRGMCFRHSVVRRGTSKTSW